MKKLTAVVLIGLSILSMSSCKQDKDCNPDQKGFENCTKGGCNC